MRGLFGTQFVVQKTPFTGVFVGLKQHKDSTAFKFQAGPPSRVLTLLCVLLVGWLIVLPALRAQWKEMEAEVKSFIENAPEFR